MRAAIAAGHPHRPVHHDRVAVRDVERQIGGARPRIRNRVVHAHHRLDGRAVGRAGEAADDVELVTDHRARRLHLRGRRGTLFRPHTARGERVDEHQRAHARHGVGQPIAQRGNVPADDCNRTRTERQRHQHAHDPHDAACGLSARPIRIANAANSATTLMELTSSIVASFIPVAVSITPDAR